MLGGKMLSKSRQRKVQLLLTPNRGEYGKTKTTFVIMQLTFIIDISIEKWQKICLRKVNILALVLPIQTYESWKYLRWRPSLSSYKALKLDDSLVDSLSDGTRTLLFPYWLITGHRPP